ncbi:outer membrane beta-barrel protein [Sphingobacterium paludis]|uniref:Outer membrane protein with beta-barrel domain n=1 Tax=Sphingobacterium paludis TaxID=1476465 RepID=A0A4R7CU68_9SPHI|nr:outer membrane beta-barrel protein [Sphingobacterium paludis]TDS10970.1 outer membrane protein with beta-barrel domain [Sphingobacterium paludis]
MKQCRHLLILIFSLLYAPTLLAQIGLGIRLGGNLSNANGDGFRSAQKIGFQAGAALRVDITKLLAVQAEPSFNITRIRANDRTAMYPEGIQKGTKSLHYFNLPVLLKLKITPSFALLGGVEFSSLINDDKYRLNNGAPAFRSDVRFGHSLGVELSRFYFRYRGLKRPSDVHGNWHADIEQYQLGMKFDLF